MAPKIHCRLPSLALLAMTCSIAPGEVAAPVFTPVEGDSFVTFQLRIDCATPAAEIHYTLNGAEPTVYDPAIVSGGSVAVVRNLTVKAKAWVSAETGPTTTASYNFTGDVAAGGGHSLALGSSGLVWGWGNKVNGRIGNGQTTGNQLAPANSKYSSTFNIENGGMLAAGKEHGVFLKNDGFVWAFGRNNVGALGDKTTVDKSYAVRANEGAVTGNYLGNCISVAAGNGFSGALKSSGEVYVWGDQASGRLANGSAAAGFRNWADTVKRGDIGTFPVLSGIERIALADASGFAKEPSAFQAPGGVGRVWVWGSNDSGQLGQGNLTDLTRAWPMKLNNTTELTDAWDLSAANDHSAVVRWKDGDSTLQGSVWSSGQQQHGRLGNNLNTAAAISYPVVAMKAGSVPLDGILSVAAGSAHTLALDGNGNVWAWGYNLYGALGDNTTADRAHAAKVKNTAGTGDLQNIVRIAAGGTALENFSIAVASNGTVYTWGRNATGQLGNGVTSTGATKLPVAVSGIDLLPSPPDTTLSATVTSSNFPGAATLTAVPSDPDGIANISKVEFYSQGHFAGQATAAPWKLNLSNLAEGNYHVYAIVTDITGQSGHSPPASFTIIYDPAANHQDSDGDGLPDSAESASGTSATDADTDGDGIPDGIDSAPLVPDIVPLAAATTILIWAPAEP